MFWQCGFSALSYSDFKTYPVKPSFYLYFNPELILSAAVLFPESQIITNINIIIIKFIDTF